MNNNSKVQKNIAKLTRAVIHTTDSDFALLCVICLKDYERKFSDILLYFTIIIHQNLSLFN